MLAPGGVVAAIAGLTNGWITTDPRLANATSIQVVPRMVALALLFPD